MEMEGGASRQRLIMDTFVELADTLASDYDIDELLHFLVDRCARVLSADTAGVLLESPGGGLQLAAATSDEMREIEDVEIATGKGPCIEAYRSGEPVTADDLNECKDRWPSVTWRLLDMGMQSGYAFPLKLRDDRIGALNLYRREPGRLREEDIRLGQAFADVAAIGILQQRKVAAANERAAQLQRALDSRVIIEQAKGAVAQYHNISAEQAFTALRRHARNNGKRLRDVSHRVMNGGVAEIPID